MSYTHNASKTVWTVTTNNTLEDIKNYLDNNGVKAVTLAGDTLYIGAQGYVNYPDAIIITTPSDGVVKIRSKYGYMSTWMTDCGPDGLPTTPYLVLDATLTVFRYAPLDIRPCD
jgi:hypothetical protein